MPWMSFREEGLLELVAGQWGPYLRPLLTGPKRSTDALNEGCPEWALANKAFWN